MENNISNYRVSNYTIISKIPSYENRYLLVHSYSGAVDFVDENVATFLKAYSNKNLDMKAAEKHNINAITLQVLAKRGYLTFRNIEQEQSHVKNIVETIEKVNRNSKSALVFIVSYDCNFRCTYCYENTLSNHGNSWSKQTYSTEMIDGIYACLKTIDPQMQKFSNKIILYGGEPLLGTNQQIVGYLIQQGLKNNFTFEAVTNGYDLDLFTNYLSKDIISEIQITIDGPPEHHDRRRIHYKDGDTFNKILSNVELALSKNIAVKLRINVDESNIAHIDNLLSIFDKRNLLGNERLSIYSAMVDSSSNNKDCYKNGHGDTARDSSPTYSRKKYFKDYFALKSGNRMFDKVACHSNGVEDIMRRALFERTVLPFDTIFCGAQKNMLIFDPMGMLYTCWEVVGQDRYSIGSYYPEMKVDSQKQNLWYKRNVLSIQPCSKCKYALLCHGGCAGKAILLNDNYHSSHCDDFPKSFEIIAGEVAREYLEKKNN